MSSPAAILILLACHVCCPQIHHFLILCFSDICGDVIPASVPGFNLFRKLESLFRVACRASHTLTRSVSRMSAKPLSPFAPADSRLVNRDVNFRAGYPLISLP